MRVGLFEIVLGFEDGRCRPFVSGYLERIHVLFAQLRSIR